MVHATFLLVLLSEVVLPPNPDVLPVILTTIDARTAESRRAKQLVQRYQSDFSRLRQANGNKSAEKINKRLMNRLKSLEKIFRKESLRHDFRNYCNLGGIPIGGNIIRSSPFYIDEKSVRFRVINRTGKYLRLLTISISFFNESGQRVGQINRRIRELPANQEDLIRVPQTARFRQVQAQFLSGKFGMGTIMLEIDPPETQVWIDKKRILLKGQKNLIQRQLEVGEHVLNIRKDGFRPVEKRFRIENGKKQQLRIKLQPHTRKPNPTPGQQSTARQLPCYSEPSSVPIVELAKTSG